MLKPEIIKLCGEITALSVLISSITEHHIITRYAGHVHCLNVRIYKNGYEDEKIAAEVSCYIDNDSAEENLIAIKQRLESLLSELYEIDSEIVVNSSI